ncbi:MAG: DUF4384 domain-containing protein, partial [Pseudomonadota bacterium]
VLYPNDAANANFLTDGKVRAGQTVRIPDRLGQSNDAGFFWDIREPVGHDVIQVFASTDLATANDIRRYVGELANETRARAEGRLRGARETRLKTRGLLAGKGIGVVAAAHSSEAPPVATPATDVVTADWGVRAVRIAIEP